MFLGQFEHTIDDKGRMTIPSRFREQLGDAAYLTLGLDQNLVIMPAEIFEQRSDKARQPGITNEDARIFRRHFFGNASQLEFDKFGRILIPQFLRNSAQLNGAAILVGVGDDIEIWSPQLWAEQVNKMQDTAFLAEHTSQLDI